MKSDFIIKNIIFLFIFQVFARTILKKYKNNSEKKHIEDIFKKKYFSNIAEHIFENVNKSKNSNKKKSIFTKISDVNNFIKSKYNEEYIKNELEKNMKEYKNYHDETVLPKSAIDAFEKSGKVYIDNQIVSDKVSKSLNNALEEILLDDISKKNILIDNNKDIINYNFMTKKDKKYKIKCNIIFKNSVKNIILIISDDTNKFIYNISQNHLIDGLISKYEFILDNNNFNDNKKINIIIKTDENAQKTISSELNSINYNLNIIEKEKNNILNNPFIIFNINDIHYPVYFDEIDNILNFDNEKDKIENNEHLFFI